MQPDLIRSTMAELWPILWPHVSKKEEERFHLEEERLMWGSGLEG